MTTAPELLTPDMARAAKAFRLGTGVPCFYIDARGRRILPCSEANSSEAFCLNCVSLRNGECERVSLYGRYQAERFGGRYIYFCPSGLTYCVSPVFSDTCDVSALFAGPLLMVDPDEFLLEDLFHPGIGEESSIDGMKKRIPDLPVIPTDRVSALSDLIYLMADSISKNGLRQYDHQRDLLESNAAISSSIHALKELERNGNVPQYPLDKERELLTKISMGDKSGAQRILNDILGYVYFSTGSDFDIIKARSQELVVMLSRGAMEGGADIQEIFGLNHHYLSDIRNLKSVDELSVWLSNILARFTDCVFNLSEIRHKDVIFQAITYIRRHYTQHISLDDVAKHVHLNASYLSRVFKEEMQTNFVSYVNNLRVEIGKKLLLDSSVPLLEVAGMVGFDEQSYFTKVFKKITGITPGKFRESRGLSIPHQTS